MWTLLLQFDNVSVEGVDHTRSTALSSKNYASEISWWRFRAELPVRNVNVLMTADALFKAYLQLLIHDAQYWNAWDVVYDYCACACICEMLYHIIAAISYQIPSLFVTHIWMKISISSLKKKISLHSVPTPLHGVNAWLSVCLKRSLCFHFRPGLDNKQHGFLYFICL